MPRHAHDYSNVTIVISGSIEEASEHVEMIPGIGDVLRFGFGSDAKPESVKWGDALFQRAK